MPLICLDGTQGFRTIHQQEGGKLKNLTAIPYGHTAQVKQQEQQGEVLVDRFQDHVENPGRQKEKEGREQKAHKPGAEKPFRGRNPLGRGRDIHRANGCRMNPIFRDEKGDKVGKIEKPRNPCGPLDGTPRPFGSHDPFSFQRIAYIASLPQNPWFVAR